MRRALVVLACLALAGCSSSSKPKSPDALDLPATSAPSASASAGARPTTVPTSAVPQPGAHQSNRAVQASPSAASPKAPGKPAPTKATAPGVYTYDASGSYTVSGAPQSAKGTATLTIGPLTDGHQHSTLHSDENDTDEDLLVRDTGTYLAALKISPPVDKEFRPSPAALLLPDPATVGKTWTWTATSTDGKSTATTTNKVLRTETLTIGGQSVATVVLQTHLVLTGDVNYTADVTTWVATAYRLPVKDHTVAKGTYSGLAFSSDVTSIMRSVHPS